MRKLDHNNITIIAEKITKTKQGYAQQIDFSQVKEDIIILAHQPGLGKTHTVLEFMKTHQDSIYLTNRHDIIKENVKNWGKGIPYVHWIGFTKICKNRTLKKLLETYHINPSILCSYCSVKKCQYKWQFKKRDRVFAPYEYLSLGQILNNLPEYLFLDEQKLNVDTLTFNYQATITWLQTIQTYSNMPTPYVTHMQNNNYQFFLRTGFNDIETIYYNEALENAYKKKQMADILTITSINPYLLEKYFKLANTYNDYNRKEYYFPLCYNAFDVLNKRQKQTKLIFMDASFNQRLFRYFLEAFNGEIGFKNPVSVKIYYSNVTNKHTDVYSMRTSDKFASWLPKVSFRNIDSMLHWLPKHIQHIKEIYGEENIGIITFKKIAKSGYVSLLGYEIQYFGGLRSSNSFKDKKALIVLGTFFESKDNIFEYLEKIFDIHDKSIIVEERETKKLIEKIFSNTGSISKRSIPSLYDQILEPKRRKRFTNAQDFIYDPSFYLEGYIPPTGPNISQQDQYDMIQHQIYPVEWIQQVIWDEEMYQAFHRNRGLLNDRVIFAYCWFPPEIIDEFRVEAIKRDKKEEDKLWNTLEQQEEKRILHQSLLKDIEEFISKKQFTIKKSLQNPKGSLIIVTTLAKKYKMNDKTGRDAIKKLIYAYYTTKNSVKK